MKKHPRDISTILEENMQSRSNKQFCTQDDTRGDTLRPETDCGETRKRASESEVSWLQGIHLAHPLVRKQIGTRLRSGVRETSSDVPAHRESDGDELIKKRSH